MKALTMTIAGLLLAVATPSSWAATDKLTIGDPDYGGTGCPAGTASATVSPDGQELSVLFDQYVANNGRKNCALTIPLHVPNGFQVAIYTMDYRGYVAPRTIGKFTTDYFFAGQRSTPSTKTFRGETNYSTRDTIGTMTNVWSRCGDNLNMRINTGMVASGRGDASVDSVDAAAGIIYHIRYRACR